MAVIRGPVLAKRIQADMTPKEFAEAVAAHMQFVRDQLYELNDQPAPEDRIHQGMTRPQLVSATSRFMDEAKEQIRQIKARRDASWRERIAGLVPKFAR